MHVDLGRQRVPFAGQHVADVIAAGSRSIEATPAHQLRAPGDVGVFAIHEEIRVEELALDRNIVDHLPAIQRRRGGRAEDVFKVQVVASVGLLAAPVQVPQHGREIDAGRIHQLLFRQIETGADAEQLAADGAGFAVHAARQYQLLYEVLHQQDIRIQRQHPSPVRKSDGLVLRRRESNIFLVVVNAASIRELLQNIHGAVGRGVVDHYDFKLRICLLENRFQASPDESAAVIGDQRY